MQPVFDLRKYFPPRLARRGISTYRCGSFRLSSEGPRASFGRPTTDEQRAKWNYSEDMPFVPASSFLSSIHRFRRHCSYQTTKSTFVLLHHKRAYILVRACLCLVTYTFTLDTDSLETLEFNPRTPTLRLRPMTSRLIEYHWRCSLPRPLQIPIIKS